MGVGCRGLGIDGWKLSEDGDFKVKELSRLIEDKILQVENDAQETLWKQRSAQCVQAFGSAMSVFGSVSLQWSGFYWTLVFNTRRPMKFICIRTVWLYASLSSGMSAGDATCLCVQGFVSSANVQAASLQSSIHTCVFGSAGLLSDIDY
ncbi:hypothetical protein Tco_1447140 [Tanacetum coccineum]